MQVYLDWLDLYIPVAGTSSASSSTISNISVDGDLPSHSSLLLQEWHFVTTVCPQVLHAYTLAATRFW